jgi:NTP pyrophosphatase (non-canonical NTP hydrolase)
MHEKVFALILAERERQDAKWGSQRHLAPLVWLAVLTEEIGEVAKAILEHEPSGVRDELVQVAAVAVAWLSALIEEA